MEGTCNCGAVTVKVTDSELFTRRRGHTCRCLNCKKTASSCKFSLLLHIMHIFPCSPFLYSSSNEAPLLTNTIAVANNLIIENSKIEITGAQNLKMYSDPKTLSGTPLQRFFCGTCGK